MGEGNSLLVRFTIPVFTFDMLKLVFSIRARLLEYRREHDRAKSSFYNRVTIQQRKRINGIRREELDVLMVTMTLNELRERAFNPPEGRHFRPVSNTSSWYPSNLTFLLMRSRSYG